MALAAAAGLCACACTRACALYVLPPPSFRNAAPFLALPPQIKGKHTKTSEALAAHVAEKARPALRKPTNMEQLKSACLGRKWSAAARDCSPDLAR